MEVNEEYALYVDSIKNELILTNNVRLNLKDDLSRILEFYIKDRTLEGFWDNRNKFKWRTYSSSRNTFHLITYILLNW